MPTFRLSRSTRSIYTVAAAAVVLAMQNRAASGQTGLTFNEQLCDGGGDAVLVLGLAHVLGLVLQRHLVDDERAAPVAELNRHVLRRRDLLTVLNESKTPL